MEDTTRSDSQDTGQQRTSATGEDTWHTNDTQDTPHTTTQTERLQQTTRSEQEATKADDETDTTAPTDNAAEDQTNDTNDECPRLDNDDNTGGSTQPNHNTEVTNTTKQRPWQQMQLRTGLTEASDTEGKQNNTDRGRHAEDHTTESTHDINSNDIDDHEEVKHKEEGQGSVDDHDTTPPYIRPPTTPRY